MGKAKHTQGPWSIDPRACTHVIAGDRGICSTGGEADNSDPEATNAENKANAQLIAAAPQMLAFCERATEHLASHCDCDVDVGGSQQCLWHVGLAALAAARGEAPNVD